MKNCETRKGAERPSAHKLGESLAPTGMSSPRAFPSLPLMPLRLEGAGALYRSVECGQQASWRAEEIEKSFSSSLL